MTDSKLAQMDPVKVTLESLERAEIPYKIYDKVRVEPSDERYDSFLSPLQCVVRFAIIVHKCCYCTF